LLDNGTGDLVIVAATDVEAMQLFLGLRNVQKSDCRQTPTPSRRISTMAGGVVASRPKLN